MIRSILKRMQLAWRQGIAGLRGQDLDASNRWWACILQAKLADYERRAASRKIEVRTIELVDYGLGIEGFASRSDEAIRKRIRSRGFSVPVAFLEPLVDAKRAELAIDFAVSKELCRSMKDGGAAAIKDTTERAAARMGIALVCGPEAARC